MTCIPIMENDNATTIELRLPDAMQCGRASTHGIRQDVERSSMDRKSPVLLDAEPSPRA